MLGRSVGNYQLVAKIGEGGMGAVYLAQHKTLRRRVAVKILRAELSANADIVARFHNEARAATAVHHPGIVEVYDVGVLEDRAAYIIMELLDGESLAARLGRGKLALVTALAILRAVARALQAAHELGIVHRDLKPDNIFLVPDPELASGERVKLLDFGIAKLSPLIGETSHTRTGVVMGTPMYMAPEQCRGAGAVDLRADLYALGCIAYEMVCGEPPFAADGAGEIIAHHLYFEPPRPRDRRPDLPSEIEALILQLLRKKPAERPATAYLVVEHIDRLIATAPTLIDERRDASVVTLLPRDPRSLSVTRSLGPVTVPMQTSEIEHVTAATTLSGAASMTDESELPTISAARSPRVAYIAGISAALIVLAVAVIGTRTPQPEAAAAAVVPPAVAAPAASAVSPPAAPAADPAVPAAVPVVVAKPAVAQAEPAVTQAQLDAQPPLAAPAAPRPEPTAPAHPSVAKSRTVSHRAGRSSGAAASCIAPSCSPEGCTGMVDRAVAGAISIDLALRYLNSCEIHVPVDVFKQLKTRLIDQG